MWTSILFKVVNRPARDIVMIISVREFNRLGVPIVCPITLGGSFARDGGFAVSLTGTGLAAQGVVLCNQLRALDLNARRAKFIEKVPREIIDEVLGKVAVLFE